jgi:uracil-DNA glycosylase
MKNAESNPLRGTDWYRLLREEFDKPYWKALQAFVAAEPSVYPPLDKVFTAMQLTPYAETKVVIVGQDPYYRAGQADGLCFSVPRGMAVPSSLRNIHLELNKDLDVPIPDHGSLEPWARRGVLLLNTILTVREGVPRSHRSKGWERFTDEVIRIVAAKPDLVFILWGEDAQSKKKKLIYSPRRTIIESSHPSPRTAHNGFLRSKPFSRANSALLAAEKEEIDWRLTD